MGREQGLSLDKHLWPRSLPTWVSPGSAPQRSKLPLVFEQNYLE